MNNALTILPQSEENSFSDKYKIWDIDHKKMLLAYTRPAKVFSSTFYGYVPENKNIITMLTEENYIQLQGTSKLDFEKKEIFEGDFVINSSGRILEVKRKNENWYLKSINDVGSFKPLSARWAVIGNVYETPELPDTSANMSIIDLFLDRLRN